MDRPSSVASVSFDSAPSTARFGDSGAHDDSYQMYEDGYDSALALSRAPNENFKVAIRVRPPLPREYKTHRAYQNTTMVDQQRRTITLSDNLPSSVASGNTSTAHVDNGIVYSTYRYTFDRVYGPDASQEEVYDNSARDSVKQVLEGYNAAIIAYGQTGTGKTFTMEGERTGPGRGIIRRAIEDIFAAIEHDAAPQSKFLVRASYLQIYNEVISDLLKPERTNLGIREDRKRGIYVDGLSEWVVRSPDEVYGLMERGAEQRATGATKLNEMSSRSHAVFIIIVEQSVLAARSDDGGVEAAAQQIAELRASMAHPGATGDDVRRSVRVGKLNLVDLAGSERVHITGATGKRLEESKKINQSLSALGNVIAALTDARGSRPHVPYRDSRLTRILEDSLGGNCKTTMMCMTSPALEAFAESLSTLKFANRAKNIKNAARLNEDVDQRTLLRKYERELRRLRAELLARQASLVDARRLLQVEEQKRRAEADKLAAITALEQRSRDFMAEKEANRRLEQKIASMQSQLLTGGAALQDTPAFRNLVAAEQRRLRQQYEARLVELEAERQGAEADLAQVPRYKALLLKQRDIMIALTERLQERDERILALQDDLGASDAAAKRLQDELDQRSAELIALRKAAVEEQAAAPGKSAPLQSALGRWGAGPLVMGSGDGGSDAGKERPVLGELRDIDAASDRSSVTGDGNVFHSSSGLLPRDGGNGAGGSSCHAGGSGGHADGGGGGGGYAAGHLASRHGRSENAGASAGGDSRQRPGHEAQSLSHADAVAAQQAAAEAARQLAAAERRLQELQQDRQQLESLAAERDQVRREAEAALQEQRGNEARERAALRTILDTKMRNLLADLGRGLSELPPGVRLSQRAPRQLVALENLLTATVNAISATAP